MIVSIVKYLGLFMLLVLIQLFIVNNIFFGSHYAFLFQPQLLVMFLLFLPPSMSHTWLIFVSFAAGFVFDVFFQSWGIHAAVSTVVGFVRHYATRDVENVIAAREEENQIWTSKKGRAWKWSYFLTFVALYHFLYLFADSLGYNFFLRLLPAFVSSTIICFLLILIIENLIYKPSRN